jgi:hypothetical protein
VDIEPPIVVASATRHGVTPTEALHAWAFAVDSYILSEEMVMYIGPDRAGNLLEIGVVEWHEALAIVHSMPARPKFWR